MSSEREKEFDSIMEKLVEEYMASELNNATWGNVENLLRGRFFVSYIHLFLFLQLKEMLKVYILPLFLILHLKSEMKLVRVQ